jgi:hypothetical protein
MIGPSPLAFPREDRNAPISSSERNRAVWAAELALVRGDLWAENAIAQSSEVIRNTEPQKAAQSADQVSVAHSAAKKAAAMSPLDSRVWLILASLDCLLHREASGALKMSYYTGSNETVLMPLRLLVATCLDSINDSELQNLVTREIQLIITQKQGLKPAILAAYQKASPGGKHLLETVVGDIDSDLMAAFRSTKRPE